MRKLRHGQFKEIATVLTVALGVNFRFYTISSLFNLPGLGWPILSKSAGSVRRMSSWKRLLNLVRKDYELHWGQSRGSMSVGNLVVEAEIRSQGISRQEM